MATYLTPEEEDSILADYLAGEMTGHQIAAKHSRTVATVFRLVKRRGQLGRRKSRPGRVSPLHALFPEIKAAYEAGACGPELGRRYGMNGDHIVRWLGDQGVPIRHRAAWHPDDEEWQAILAEYRAGIVPATQIAEDHNVSPSVLYRVLQERGEVGRSRKAYGRFLPTDHLKMCDLYRAGESLTGVARKFGCTHPAVRTILLANGVKLRPQGRAARTATDEQVDEMVQRWLGGEAQAAIAKDYGISQAHVSSLMRGQVPETRLKAMRASRSRHGMWKGGRLKVGDYFKVLLEPSDALYSMAMTNGYVLEHRLVMARALGRPLTQHETVHHIDGDTTHNDLSNLQLRNGKHGKGVVLACADCGSHDIIAVPLKSAEEA